MPTGWFGLLLSLLVVTKLLFPCVVAALLKDCVVAGINCGGCCCSEGNFIVERFGLTLLFTVE